MNKLRALRQPFLENWFSLNGPVFFVVLCLLYFCAFLIKRLFIFDQIAAFEVLTERGEMWVMDLLFALQYFSVPFFLGFKFTLTSFLLWTGCFLFGYRVTYAQLWKLVMIMELVFIVPELLKVVWFMLLPDDPSYYDFVAFYPLSLMHFVNYEVVASAYHYPLKALNLFELVYWVALTLGIWWLSNKELRISAFIVGSSYVLFFLIWLGYYLVVYK